MSNYTGQKFVDARECKLSSLFDSSQDAYRIPLYQRPYSWTKDQWENLFEDITFVSDDKIHFLGSIVVVPEGSHRLGVNFFEVVDGQQRLATLLIWLAAIRDLSIEKGEEPKWPDKPGLFFVTDYTNGVKFPKLQLGKFDDDAFQKVLKGLPKNEKHLIIDCYNYFKGKTRDTNLWQKILYNVFLVHINAFSHLNAFRLFETLNDRGLELSAADLLKNYILMRVSSNRELFEVTIDEWMEMYEKTREYEPVKFLRRYLLSEWSGKLSESRLYEEVTDKLKEKNDEEVYNFVKALNSAATNYKKIFEISFHSDRVNKKLSEMHLIEVSPSFTLLLKIIPCWLKELLSEDDLLDIMEMIEVFHIRWGICEQATSKLDRIYNDICMKINNIKPEEFKRVIIQAFYSEFKNNIDDEIFKRNFINREFKPSEPRTKYILWKLSKPTGETSLNLKEIQTEHIMPKKLSNKWINYLKENTNKSQEEIDMLHKNYLNRIGNLTIIRGDWNTNISNKLFEEKKDEYAKSEFQITQLLSSKNSWTFDDIEERTKSFAESALEIWRWKWQV